MQVVFRKSDIRYLQESFSSGWSTKPIFNKFIDDINEATVYNNNIPRELKSILEKDSNLVLLDVSVQRVVTILE